MFQGDSKNKSYVVHEFKAGLNAKVIILSITCTVKLATIISNTMKNPFTTVIFCGHSGLA